MHCWKSCATSAVRVRHALYASVQERIMNVLLRPRLPLHPLVQTIRLLSVPLRISRRPIALANDDCEGYHFYQHYMHCNEVLLYGAICVLTSFIQRPLPLPPVRATTYAQARNVRSLILLRRIVRLLTLNYSSPKSILSTRRPFCAPLWRARTPSLRRGHMPRREL